jgi:type I restriction enzyme R subunit
MSIYNIVASTDEATVVAEYAAEYNVRPEKYQSEAELERDFIRQLTSQDMNIFQYTMKLH